jgi:hypothetical protein
VTAAPRGRLLVRGLRLEYLTVGWNIAEGLIAVDCCGRRTPWATLRTQDVHSLAFVGGDPAHVLLGHHGGLLESRDGGPRTWSALPVRDDAMTMAPADDGSIVIAGHLVFTASRDGGATWASITADLPSLDIHGSTRDPADPARMWAYPGDRRPVGEHRLRSPLDAGPGGKRRLPGRRP